MKEERLCGVEGEKSEWNRGVEERDSSASCVCERREGERERDVWKKRRVCMDSVTGSVANETECVESTSEEKERKKERKERWKMFESFFGVQGGGGVEDTSTRSGGRGGAAYRILHVFSAGNGEEERQEAKGVVPFCAPEGFREARNAMLKEDNDRENVAAVGGGGNRRGAQSKEASRFFAFVLTRQDGARVRGFCMRHLVRSSADGGTEMRAYCFTSRNAYYTLFCALLERLAAPLLALGDDVEVLGRAASATAASGADIASFLIALQSRGTPSPSAVGMPFELQMPGARSSNSSAPSPAVFSVPDDSLGMGIENADVPLAPLLYRLPVAPFVSLLAALLHERRIVVTSRSIPALSNAVIAATAMIWPFQWSHIALPVLPLTFIDYLTAPMPFLVGLPHSMMHHMEKMAGAMDEVVLIDIDSGTVEVPNGDNEDAEQLPPRSRRSLFEDIMAIRDSLPTSVDDAVWGKAPQGSNGRIVGALRKFFLSIFAGYRRFVREDFGEIDGQGGKTGALASAGLWFDQEAFLASTKSKRTRAFLDSFRHSQMFEVFISERLAAFKAELDSPECEDEHRVQRDAFDEDQPVSAAESSSRHANRHQHRRSFSSRMLRSFYQTTEIRPHQKSKSNEYGNGAGGISGGGGGSGWVESVNVHRSLRGSPRSRSVASSVDGELSTSGSTANTITTTVVDGGAAKRSVSFDNILNLSMSDSDDEVAGERRQGRGGNHMNRVDSSTSSLALGSSASDASIAAISNGGGGVNGFDVEENWRPDAEVMPATTDDDPGKALSIALGLLDMDGSDRANPTPTADDMGSKSSGASASPGTGTASASLLDL